MATDDQDRFPIVSFDSGPQAESVSGQHLGVLHRLLRHNLRNHLTTIRGNGELVRDEPERDHESAGETIVREADRIAKIAENEMLLIRIIQEQPDPEPLRLQPILAQIVTEYREMHPSAEIELAESVDAIVSVIPSIKRAIEELVDNAIVHNPNSTPRVRISATSAGDRVNVRVEDDSSPIPRQELDVLQDIHSQKPLFHASGLGLWMVRWIVDFSGGGLQVHTNDAGGNTVILTLPKADLGGT